MDVGNFKIVIEGPKNMLQKTRDYDGDAIQWLSCSAESMSRGMIVDKISCHLWLLGFRIFELVISRKN